MKKYCILLLALLPVLLSGCAAQTGHADVTAVSRPVYLFTSALCEGTGLNVACLIDSGTSCLHDYSLTITEMKNLSRAGVVVCSGGGLEDFMADAIAAAPRSIDAGAGIEQLDSDEGPDPHYWLDPALAEVQVRNIAAGLSDCYPEYADTFSANADAYCTRLEALKAEGLEKLKNLSCRELITFHDGFAYFARAFDLDIAAAVEEESGSEASAAELKELCDLVRTDGLPAIFIERNGSDAAANIIARETGCRVAVLDMIMSEDEDDYFTAMERNLDSIAEALQ